MLLETKRITQYPDNAMKAEKSAFGLGFDVASRQKETVQDWKSHSRPPVRQEIKNALEGASQALGQGG